MSFSQCACGCGDVVMRRRCDVFCTSHSKEASTWTKLDVDCGQCAKCISGSSFSPKFFFGGGGLELVELIFF